MSATARLCSEARETAMQLGHKLAGFRFRYFQAEATCETCGSSLLVSDHVLGAAATLPCKRGEPVKPEPAKPAPPTGKAKRRPAPTPTTDDVPWFLRDNVPAAVRS